MRALIACFLLVALAGCSSRITDSSRTSMIGMPVTDLAGCAGRPDKTWHVSPDDWILQYEQTQPVQPPFILKTTFVASSEIDIGARGTCHTIFRVHGGYVASVHFTGPSLTLSGPNGACAPMIRECVTRADHTTLPVGYDLGKWLHE